MTVRVKDVDFPETFCHLVQSDCPSTCTGPDCGDIMQLAGTGVRGKRIVFKNIDVYALGMYVDKTAARKALGPKYRGKAARDLSNDQLLCDEVVQSNDIPKSMRIVITSGMVNSERFAQGIRETLAPALEKAGDSESFGKFESLLKGANFRKGLELGFTSTPDGSLATRVDSKDVGTIESSKFTRSFFNMFVGESPVSPHGKRSIQQGLAAMVTEA